MKSPTGRLTNSQPEIQDLRWGRRHTTVSEHMVALAAIDLSGAELRITMLRELDEYFSKAAVIDVSREKAEEVLEEERKKLEDTNEQTWPAALENAWRRLIE